VGTVRFGKAVGRDVPPHDRGSGVVGLSERGVSVPLCEVIATRRLLGVEGWANEGSRCLGAFPVASRHSARWPGTAAAMQLAAIVCLSIPTYAITGVG